MPIDTRGAGTAPAHVPYTELGSPALAGWSGFVTCYTAALGTWIAADAERWWRPLLASGPVLRVRPSGELFAFDHHAAAPCPALGLSLRTACDWAAAWAGLCAEAGARGRVVVACDTFSLPWQPGYARSHAPHWIVLRAAGDAWLVDDPLELASETGRQRPVRVSVAASDLEHVLRALPAGDRVHALRESSVLGLDDPRLGEPYRWLAADRAPVPAQPLAAAPAVSAASLALLARHFRDHGSDPAAYRQADDMWQALRQRELAAAAARREDGAPGMPQAAAWEQVLLAWRKLPPLLMLAGLSAGTARSAKQSGRLADALDQLAEAEAARTGQTFPP